MTATATDTDTFLEQFPLPLTGNLPQWLIDARRNARDSFESQGLPTIHAEDWRFTNIAPLFKLPLKPAPISAGSLLREIHLAQYFAPMAGPRVVFVNGRYVARLSSRGALPDGVHIKSISEVLLKKPGQLEAHFRDTAHLGHPFAALNAAQFEDGVFIHLEPRAWLNDPVQLLYFSTGGEQATFNSPRTIIHAENNAAVRVVESYAGTGAYFCNAATQVIVEDNAAVELTRLQRESDAAIHFGLLDAKLGRDCRLNAQSIALGASIARVDIETRLNGLGASCDLAGLGLGRAKQLLDHHVLVDHTQPHGKSAQFFRNVLDEKSRGVFSGKVIVRPGAQKTDARQTNNNLLLSDDAMIDTKPQLEIYADDVKCSHGATSGKLDDEALFFLRSRGLSQTQSRSLLTLAFAGEVLSSVKFPELRGQLEELLHKRFV